MGKDIKHILPTEFITLPNLVPVTLISVTLNSAD